MKRNLKKAITALLAAIIAASAFAASAATVTPNSGYTVVTEDFSAVTDHNKVSYKVNGNTNATAISNTFYKSSRTNQIGDSNWVFKTTGEYNPTNADAYISDDGALMINGGSVSFTSFADRLISVYYNGDYSNVGNDFKISYDFSKSVNVGAAVKFMISEDAKSYYALNMETKDGSNVWNLYKMTNGTPTVLASSKEKITATTDNTGNGGTNAGNITVAYNSGKISWNITANRYGNIPYTNSGSYTDSAPFTLAPSAAKIGFSANNCSTIGTFATVDNVKFSYATANVSENFEGSDIVSGTTFANSKESKETRTNITGTDFYVTTRNNPMANRLEATVDSNKLKLNYKDYSVWKFANRQDFAEYRGSYDGIRDNYTISFDYNTTTARNTGIFMFGMPENAADNYIYNDYYVFVFSGVSDVNYYVQNGEATAEKPIPSWEIRHMQGGDTYSDTLVKSDHTFFAPADSDALSTINKYGTKSANVKLNVNGNTVTVTVTATAADGAYSDTKAFNLTSDMAGNHFAFSNASSNGATGYFDNITVTTTQSAIESDADNLYINSGKFALGDGSLLFYNNDGTCTLNPIEMDTFETHTIAIPSGTKKIFFWKDLDTIIPITESIDIE